MTSATDQPAETVDLDTKVAFLKEPRHYPPESSPNDVEMVETHMAWVFMTDTHVYKLKKPVRYSFLDFSTVHARHEDCRREVELNRRLAEDVYLGIVALRRDRQGGLRLDEAGLPVDWLVKMRRLPSDRMLDRLIHTGTLTERDIHSFMDKLIRFYMRGDPVTMTATQYLERFRRDIRANRDVLMDGAFGLDADQVARLTRAQLNRVDHCRDRLGQRAEANHILEAHGDLRPEHICLTPEPMIIDCLEFNRDFRLLDPVDELAFLAMECHREGAAYLRERIFALYGEATGDDPDPELVTFYMAYRATLRAKLAIWHLRDGDSVDRDKWSSRAREYLALAEDCLAGA